jgi:transcription-repair coupling factor (superfamily II helicase)
MLGAAIGLRRQATVLFICPHLDDADTIADDIEALTGMQAELFPAWELGVPESADQPTIAADHVSDEITGQRLKICTMLTEAAAGSTGFQPVPSAPRTKPDRLQTRPAKIGTKEDRLQTCPTKPPTMARFIVAPIAAVLQPVPTPEALAKARFRLEKGMEVGPEKLAQWLVDEGFEAVEAIDQQGEFARRGGIIDVFQPGWNQPVRIEFFGDQIESIRRFDLDTQRSTDAIDGCDLISLAAARRAAPAATTHVLDYLPPNAIVCIIEPVEVASLAETFYRRVMAELTDRNGALTAAGVKPEVVAEPAANILKPEIIFQAAARRTLLEMYAFGPGEGEGVIQVGIRSIQRLEVDTAQALDELELLAKTDQVWVYCENPAERDRFLELLRTGHPLLAEKVQTALGHISHGFHWPAERLVVVGHHEIYHRYARPRAVRRVRAGRPIDSFLDLQEGDYVVHVGHGIARFEGLRTLAKEGSKEEYLTLKFAEGALLHVPVTQIQLVQKYVGAGKAHPTLSHLGGSAWSIRKQKVAEAVRDMAADLLRVQAIRASAPGLSYPGRSDWQTKFEGEFVYTETEDQLVAMNQIYADLAEPRPMDRLLCGDVGYGKTELAMRAAFKVAEAGKQVAVLVPTTVLAAQHYRTFTERFADYPMTIDVLSRFRTRQQQGQIIGQAMLGEIDILIGTHRMLSVDVQFADLGLVIIDEEQRFGVEHKERLKRMRATVDVLTMTATPIPRTLHMALLGLRDISNLMTPPLDRRAIYTEVSHARDDRVRAIILRELARQGQVFYVHNRVQNIESTAEHIRALAGEARVDIGHGQMPEGALEKTMLRFVRGDIDVLVCTTIIESGLDIPAANTMIIDEADRFGLSQLHQLRGRIGRYKNRAYCYLLLPPRRPLSPIATKRLKAVEEFSDLGAGFQIAMRDLEIRGAGNILGGEQSGHIAAVGYELYCRMLEQSVHQLRGEKPPVRHDAHVELGSQAYIPRAYIASARQRMEIYRRLALCESTDALNQLAKDLTDAFGTPPAVVDTMLALADVRIHAAMGGIASIILMPPDVVFSLADPKRAKKTLAGLAGTVRLPDEKTAHWRPPPAYLEHPTLLTVLRKHLRQRAEGR